MEPGLVRLHHPDWAPELYGGEGPHPGQHRDIRLHGELGGGKGGRLVSSAQLGQGLLRY